jgi:hypothetical protein
MQTLAVDGDILAYRIASVADDLEGATDAVDSKLNDISTFTGVSSMRTYLSGANNFRDSVAVTKPYKGNRSGNKPDLLPHVRAYLQSEYKAVEVDGYEADDAIASDMIQNGAIHCGQDKDLYQIKGLHYNFVTQEWKDVSFDEAVINLHRQILTGDATDNIQGLVGVGDKTAAKVITEAKTAPQDARDYYMDVCVNKMGMTEDETKDYWTEQVKLIQLVGNLNPFEFFTTQVKGSFLKI